ncbi:carbohydrate ABC transporter permease [Jiella sonneratiae]|uniref:Maltose/maltodextrin transport system permease protein MalG n=1 Tax=Jiella sonneratiae TaxID=2816856 RepID=A0ABS3J6S4_9HYPH|nr:carbohydrate ABC transporter permease [Jiella sonneratiae]MBO0904822.1 carbohydrate ABC transporter permease [Jiella sonneratiae]
MILSRREKFVCYAVTYLFALFLLAPIVWMLSTSFKGQLAIFQKPPSLFTEFTFQNYAAVLSDPQFLHAFWNSVLISSGTVVVSVALAVPAAYGLSHLTGGRRAGFLSWVLLVRAAPGMIYVLPYYLAYSQIGLIDTRIGLILINSVFTIPLAIWIVIPFFDAIPHEIEEAAIIDGATRFQTMTRIAIPLAAPGIASTAILIFIFAWNEFLFALTLTRFEARTAAVSILSYMAYEGTEWGKVAAAGALILLPVLCFSILIRKYLVQTTAGGVKG